MPIVFGNHKFNFIYMFMILFLFLFDNVVSSPHVCIDKAEYLFERLISELICSLENFPG